MKRGKTYDIGFKVRSTTYTTGMKSMVLYPISIPTGIFI
jgi:hypothetical protein